MNLIPQNKERVKNTYKVFLIFLSYFSAAFTIHGESFTLISVVIVFTAMLMLFKEKEFYLILPLFIFFYSDLILPGGVSLFRIYSILFVIKIFLTKKIKFDKIFIIPFILLVLYFLLVIAQFNFRGALFVVFDTFFILLYISNVLREKSTINNFFKYYSFAALAAVLYGIMKIDNQSLSKVYLDGEWVGFTRFLATFDDPNYLGFFINIAIFSVLILKNFSKIKKIAILIIFYFTLFATVSTTALLCNALSIILFLVLTKGFSKKIMVSFSVIFIVFFVYRMTLTVDIPVFTNFAIRFNSQLDSFFNQEFTSLTSNRSNIWETHLNYFIEQPMLSLLLGGNFITDIGYDISKFSGVSHQALIDMLLNFGLIGTVTLMGFYLLNTRSYIINYLKSKDDHVFLIIVIKFIWIFYALGLSMFPSWMFNIFFFL